MEVGEALAALLGSGAEGYMKQKEENKRRAIHDAINNRIKGLSPSGQNLGQGPINDQQFTPGQVGGVNSYLKGTGIY